MIIDKNEIITCESYKGLCDKIYKVGDNVESGLWHVNMEEIPAFFEAIKDRSDRYIIVSSCSDFGICYQEKNPVWADIPKWARIQATPEVGYKDALLQTRCNTDKCKEADRYSVKCYAWTEYTFPAIPNNIVHWFTTNSKIPNEEDSRITIIPFGIAPNKQQEIAELAAEFQYIDNKEPKIYINWVNYTVERLEIKEYYKLLNNPNIVIIDEAKPYKEYLCDLARYAIVLSPEGNGLDCYRNLETLYMGSMPVIPLNAISWSLRDLPIAVVKTMYGLRPNELYEVFKTMKEQRRNMDRIHLSYWKQRFEEARKLL